MKTPMKVEITFFVNPGVSAQDLRSYVDAALEHAQSTIMAERVGQHIFLAPSVQLVSRRPS